MRQGWCFWPGLLLLWLWAPGCADPAPPSEAPQGDLQQLTLTPVLVDDLIVEGGSLLLRVQGAELLVPTQAHILLRGRFEGAPAGGAYTLTPTPGTEPQDLELAIPWEALQGMEGFAPQGSFQGHLQVTLDDLSAQLQGQGQLAARITLVPSLRPSLSTPASIQIHLNQEQSWPAQGLLRPGEGTCVLHLEGDFVDDRGRSRALVGDVPVTPGPTGRTQAVLRWSPALWGVRPGVFTGVASLISSSQAGRVVAPTSLTRIELLPGAVLGLDPPAISRGQRFQLLGRGLIPARGNEGQTMFFALEGTFTTASGQVQDWTGGDALRLFPDLVQEHDRAQLSLRTEQDELGSLTGLSARPGTFEGAITPIYLDASGDVVQGEPWRGSLQVAPTQQVVHLIFLPGYSDALERFGLRNLEPEIRARALEVLRRNFAGFHVAFTDRDPSGWNEYTAVEIGGQDPNGAGLLGLDNSEGLDRGNLRLDDRIGGQNAEALAEGRLAYGGVFVDSFVYFSPTLSPQSALVSPAFDDLFSPTMPELGGTPAQAGELNDPQGRRGSLARAVRAMGSLIGHTISHELGHALGMATGGQGVHNATDEPGSLMDSGPARPFEERCDLEGADFSRFNEKHRVYLEQILPLE